MCFLLFFLPTGVPIKAPIMDGVAGTVFAMEASIRSLAQQLPPERKTRPTVAILGGGGYIGARLVAVLASELAPADVTASLNEGTQVSPWGESGKASAFAFTPEHACAEPSSKSARPIEIYLQRCSTRIVLISLVFPTCCSRGRTPPLCRSQTVPRAPYGAMHARCAHAQIWQIIALDSRLLATATARELCCTVLRRET
jgi:hypothetical protein